MCLEYHGDVIYILFYRPKKSLHTCILFQTPALMYFLGQLPSFNDKGSQTHFPCTTVEFVTLFTLWMVSWCSRLCLVMPCRYNRVQEYRGSCQNYGPARVPLLPLLQEDCPNDPAKSEDLNFIPEFIYFRKNIMSSKKLQEWKKSKVQCVDFIAYYNILLIMNWLLGKISS